MRQNGAASHSAPLNLYDNVHPIAVGQAAIDILYPALLAAGGRAYGTYGRGVVLVDLRPEAETAVSYIPGTLLAASDTLLAASDTLLAASDTLLPPYSRSR